MTIEEDQEVIKVEFKFMQSGWRYESRKLSKQDVKILLDGAVVVDVDFNWTSDKIRGLTLRLKDDRKCELSEENEMYYDCSAGWINIFVSEDWSE